MQNSLFRKLSSLQVQFLLALVLIGIFPSGLVSLVLINLESKALTDQSTRELTGLARGIAKELDTFLEEVLMDSEAISELPDIVSMDPNQQTPLLLGLHAHYGRHMQLAVAKLSGGLQAAAVTPPIPLEQVSIAKIQSFQIAATQGKQAWWVGPALFNDSLILHMHTPIKDTNDQVIGVLGSPVSLPRLSSLLEQLDLGSNGQAFVLDDTGKILLHPDAEERDSRRSYATWISSADGGLPSTSGTATYSLGGETRIAGFVPIPELGWTIVVDRPEAEVLSPVIASRNLTISGMVVSIILSVFAAVFLARGLTRPVRELSAAARALGAGDSDAPLPETVVDGNELATLVTAFATMREAIIEREGALQNARDDLEDRVADRTAKLASVNAALTQEVAERRRVMDSLKESEEQFRLIFELAPIGITTATIEGVFLHPNQAYCDMIGYSAEELREKKYLEITHPDDLGENRSWNKKLLAGEIPHFRMEKRYLTKHGEVIYIILQVALVRDANNEPTHVIAQVVDITERKHTEEALALARDQALVASQAKTELLAKVSHELRTPINAILGYAELLQEGTFGKISVPQVEASGKIIESANYLATLVSELLDQAQFEGGKIILEMTEFSVHELIRRVEPQVRLSAEAKGLTFSIKVENNLPTILVGDIYRLQQILVNLLSNAIKFTEDGEVILRFYCSNQDQWAIEVSDTGSGIPTDAQAEIFEPFRQVDGSVTRTHIGTGLGLSIVDQLTSTMGAKIHVQSSLGQGSVFTVLLPYISLEEYAA